MYETLASGVQTVVHVGPDPNLVPATFTRLADNVLAQVKGSGIGMRAMQGMANRPWLKRLLPGRVALLRAPELTQVVLEDWLLGQLVT